MSKLASLGGDKAKNCRRDFISMLRQATEFALEPYMIDIDIYNPGTLQEETLCFPMFLPHELFAAVWAQGSITFNNLMFGTEENGFIEALPTYWHHVKNSWWAKDVRGKLV